MTEAPRDENVVHISVDTLNQGESHSPRIDDDLEWENHALTPVMDIVHIEPTLKDVTWWLMFDNARKETCYIRSFSQWRTRGTHVIFGMAILGCGIIALRWVLRNDIKSADGRPVAYIGDNR